MAPKSNLARRFLRWSLITLALVFGWIVLSLLALKLFNPPTTALQLERRVESWFKPGKYMKKHVQVPLAQISPHLQWAVVAAEDGRFYLHHGFDWTEIQHAIDEALDDDQDRGRLRGASTISQQLVKNIFLTTRGGFFRKGMEAAIVPLAELILDKRRILELYLNNIEWAPGVFGAEAAARFHYRTSAARLSRDQAAHLAAVLPSPRRRSPARMDRYSAIILQRMTLMGH
ncbi:MAG: monofunctional biosynthetic peptidoglycan transglycosylase [Candidatus Solibacter usitatus]|nr:monofunctional biosynthetic peptidoglycan transglycosylase [Candidatus Solibacter usitatus]